MKAIPVEAAARLFLRRQHLDHPLTRPLGKDSLTRFVEDAGGLQLDSINVLERAHYLTLWSRFGPYDKAALDRMVYGQRALVEYWAHAACLVAASDLAGWRRAMADFHLRSSGWSNWIRARPRVLRRVEGEIRRRGPLAASAFARGGGQGWWDWKPAHHALHYLWMSGRLAVHSRRHFQKIYDLAARVLPHARPVTRDSFPRWHLRKTLHALGAAADADLARYLTFPRLEPATRRRALAAMVKDGEVVEVAVEGRLGRWFALWEDIPALESPPQTAGTTLLCPFDSLLWHRGRAKTLFGFDYKIEVYTPAARRIYGYYTLPILHEGRLIGRLDPKNHRAERRLEVRAVHFDAKPDAAALTGTARAVRSLAKFIGAEKISVAHGQLGESVRQQ
ncbi:MAG: crosslink repair DNA glycosylase YcaQ family protein [Elusimicrobia bacterium]|nr:crosslink repair DNA glycosylase YcaQ family protein [Elusimicrobiota bacterium]